MPALRFVASALGVIPQAFRVHARVIAGAIRPRKAPGTKPPMPMVRPDAACYFDLS